MAHNPYVRAPGTWIAASPITPSECENINTLLYKALNGDDGGTWAPSAAIIIGGVGMQVSGNFVATNVNNAVWPSGGSAQFNSGAFLRVGNGAIAEVQSGGILEVESGGKLEIESGAELEIQSGGLIEVLSGGTIFVRTGGQAAYESGSTTVFANGASLSIGSSGFSTTGPVQRSSLLGAAAKIQQRSKVVADADFACSTDFDYVEMNVTGATLRTLTLYSVTSPVPALGDRIVVRRTGVGTGGCQVKTEGSASYSVAFVGSVQGQAELVWDGTRWRVLGNYNATVGADAG